MRRHLLQASFVTLIATSALFANEPTVHEKGHQLTLFASDPDIVTPIGMTIDAQDRVYVIESHTHTPPADYQGPKRDRIKVFIDDDNDGVADRVEIFAEGLNQTMNLAFSKDGILYALCSHELVALPDRNNDGRCDGNEVILELDTDFTYAHASWLGVAFDEQNRAYLGRGNIGSYPYRIEGKDGSLVEGWGEGGDITRVNSDGTQVETFATGFWNPMDFKFDRAGRLMLVDNDPDARGPNRLLQVVEGGDYGYKASFGGSGQHPFQGWSGELPGTLPYLSGTGEAPSGIIDASIGSNDSYLATIWNENTIERHTVQRDGSVSKTLFMSGDKDFRPVALARDSRDNLFITDWVLVDYPNHGRGKIWRVTNMPEPEPKRLPTLSAPRADNIRDILNSSDAFRRHEGVMWLSRHGGTDLASEISRDRNARIRLGGYLAKRLAKGPKQTASIKAALNDPDRPIRQLALQWASETLDLELRDSLDDALTAGEVDKTVFEAYLAAVEVLDPEFVGTLKSGEVSQIRHIPLKLDPNFLLDLIRSNNLSASVRALALGRIDATDALDFIDSSDPELRLAAIRKASTLQGAAIRDRLTAIALDKREDSEARSEALLGLGRHSLKDLSELSQLANEANENLAIEATRLLRLNAGNADARRALEKGYASWSKDPERSVQAELAEAALFGFDPSKTFAKKRPANVNAWKIALATGGDAARGSRVFRSQQMLCISCHSADGSGSDFGPDLGGLAQSVDRASIVHSILKPSDAFTPDFQAWIIETNDGVEHTGVQIDHKGGGDILLFTTEARQNVRFKGPNIKDYRTSPYSLMPPGLENMMTVSEFRDLIAYLSTP